MRQLIRFAPTLIVLLLLILLLQAENRPKRLPYIAAAQSLRETRQHLDKGIFLIIHEIGEEVDWRNISDSLWEAAKDLRVHMERAQDMTGGMRKAMIEAAGGMGRGDLPALATISNFEASVLSGEGQAWKEFRPALRRLQASALHLAQWAARELGSERDSLLASVYLLPIHEHFSDAEWLQYHFGQRGAGESILITEQWATDIYAYAYASLLLVWDEMQRQKPRAQRWGLFYHAEPKQAKHKQDPNFLRVGDTLEVYAFMAGYAPNFSTTMLIDGKKIEVVDGIGYYDAPTKRLGEHKFSALGRIHKSLDIVYAGQKEFRYFVSPAVPK